MSPVDPTLARYMEAATGSPNPWEVALDDLRAAHEGDAADLWGRPAAEVADVRHLTVEGPDGPLRLRVYRPAGEGPLGALVWYHGGGWVVGSPVTHDRLCRELAATVPCAVVAVDYRLAPESRFPAAVRDAWAGLEWTLAQASELGIDGARVAVGGDSAGGNLAAVVARHARDAGIPLALQVLVYPVTDANFESPSYREYADDLNLTRERMRWYWDTYLEGGDPRDPDASPLLATDLAGVAPALVQVAEYDVLRSEGEAYAERLLVAGVPTTLSHYDGMVHGFLQMPAHTPTATRALEEIAAALAPARSAAPGAPASATSHPSPPAGR